MMRRFLCDTRIPVTSVEPVHYLRAGPNEMNRKLKICMTGGKGALSDNETELLTPACADIH